MNWRAFERAGLVVAIGLGVIFCIFVTLAAVGPMTFGYQCDTVQKDLSVAHLIFSAWVVLTLGLLLVGLLVYRVNLRS